ncbi:unnamed protein product [Gongylonema pulchrum]|uniref:Peptidase_M14 domain-containing protein n=1 Tax=Gongylonema pulchrum TaxID=637853 RepID=A0A183DHD4_9BILA|nr:unnamed protein product [Gongylonema pulchrum]
MRKYKGRNLLSGVLSDRRGIGREYRKYMFATHIRSNLDFICYYTGVCVSGYDEYSDTTVYPSNPPDVVIIPNDNVNRTLGNGMQFLLLFWLICTRYRQIFAS